MTEFAEYLQEKIRSAADRIWEFLTGSPRYKVAEAKERARNAGHVRVVLPDSPPDVPCSRH